MKIRTMVLAAATLGMGPGGWILPQASAQPLYDRVHVTLPYSVTVGDKTLDPGDYTIQQLRSDGSPVLLIYNGNGMKFETSAMTIKALDTKTPEDTSIILHHIGGDYYFDKIWIQGKDYGYEFPLPSAVKAREKEMAAVTVPASTATSSTTTDSAEVPPPVTDNNTATNATNSDNSQVTPPITEPVTDTNTAQVSTPQTDQSTATDLQQTEPTTSSDTDSANREKRPSSDTDDMPSTSAGWLVMLLSGGTLSGAGMMLRRKR